MPVTVPLEGTVQGHVEVPLASIPIPAPPKVGDKNIAPTTTAAQDETKKGQRFINLIWEIMQATIAGSVTITTLVVSSLIALLITRVDATEKQSAMAITAFMLISNLVSLIVGFYFGRTNHQKIGGVGGEDIGR